MRPSIRSLRSIDRSQSALCQSSYHTRCRALGRMVASRVFPNNVLRAEPALYHQGRARHNSTMIRPHVTSIMVYQQLFTAYTFADWETRTHRTDHAPDNVPIPGDPMDCMKKRTHVFEDASGLASSRTGTLAVGARLPYPQQSCKEGVVACFILIGCNP